jgi:O-antigen ligase
MIFTLFSFFSIAYFFTFLGLFFDFIPSITLFFLFSLIYIFIFKKNIFLPKKLSLFYLLFFIFSSLTLFFSYEKNLVFKNLVVIYLCFFYFLFSINFSQEIKKILNLLIIILPFVSIVIYFLATIYKWSFLKEPTSLIYNGYDHNLFADFLLLPLIFSFYKIFLENKNIYWVFIIFIFPFFLRFLARGAFLALFIILLIFIKKYKQNKINFLLSVFLSFILFFAIIFFNDFGKKIILNRISFLKINPSKTFFSKRPNYYLKSLKIFINYPFGIGPENLYFHTVKNQFNFEEGITTSHNFFIDLLVENGFGAFISFLIFLILILLNSQKNVYYYLFLGLNFVFLTDFFHRIPFFLIFYFMLIGLFFKKESDEFYLGNIYLKLISLVVFLLFVIVFLGQLFFSIKNYHLAIKINPFNWRYYYPVLVEKKDKINKEAFNNYLLQFEKIFPNSHIFNNLKAKIYRDLKDDQKAIYYQEKAFTEAPMLFESRRNDYMENVFNLYGEEKGKIYSAQFIKNFIKTAKIPKESFLYQVIIDHCRDYKLECF